MADDLDALWAQAKPIAPAGDLDALWEQAKPIQSTKTSAGKAATLGVSQGGTFGFADELGGLLGSLLVPGSTVKGEGLSEQPSSYRLVRDRVRSDADKARADQPGAFTAGELAGAIAVPIPGTGAATGATGLARVGNAALRGAGQGALYGTGASQSDLLKGDMGGLAADAALGGAFGGAGGALGQGLGEGVAAVRKNLLSRAQKGLAGTDQKLDALAQEKVLTDLKSAGGDLGTVTQGGNRLVENLIRLEGTGKLTPQQMQKLAALKASGDWDQLIQKLADSNIDELPGKAAEISSRENVLAQMQGGRSQLFQQARKDVADPMAQIKPRLQRYAAPVATALLGGSAGGIAGALAGGDPWQVGVTALAGAGVRPAVGAVQRMLKHPATQAPLLRAAAKLSASSGAPGSKLARPLSLVASRGEQEMALPSRLVADGDSGAADPYARMTPEQRQMYALAAALMRDAGR